jgi:hypothetical protein
MKTKTLFVAAGIGLVLWLLLREDYASASTSTGSSLGGFSPITIASTYFDPGQSFTVNANVNSSSYGVPIDYH